MEDTAVGRIMVGETSPNEERVKVPRGLPAPTVSQRELTLAIAHIVARLNEAIERAAEDQLLVQIHVRPVPLFGVTKAGTRLEAPKISIVMSLPTSEMS